MHYASLLLPEALRCEEPSSLYTFMTERHLHAMWYEQKYFKSLSTTDGTLIEILSPGIWNAEAGPDFLKAHLRVDGKELKGDIEIHLSDNLWNQHGHHKDSRYDNVVLHISMWTPHQEHSIITSQGRAISKIYLEPHLTIPPSRIVHLIDLDLYPYKKFVGSGRCAQTLFKYLPDEEIVSLFKSAASWRLSQKLNHLQNYCPNQQMQLAAGIALALGYKRNADHFLHLFSWLLPMNLKDDRLALAMLMQACGFFEPAYQKKWGKSTEYSQLERLRFPSPKRVHLALNQIRPLNHPLRRLVVLAKMATDTSIQAYYPRMLSHWQNQWEFIKDRKGAKNLYHQFLELLPAYFDPYWNYHYNFEEIARTQMLPLMGQDIKTEVLVNAFLPLLNESIQSRGHPHELAAFAMLYSCLPASYTGKTKYLIHRFFGDSPKGDVVHHADVEQGTYQLHRDFCTHFESSCEGCTFVERYKNNPSTEAEYLSNS